MRKRNKALILRATPKEYQLINDQIKKAGISKQKYLLHAVLNEPVISGKEMAGLTETSKKMAAQVNSLNSLLIALSQMIYEEELYRSDSEMEDIKALTDQVKKLRKESVELWELLRSLIAAQNR